MATVLTAIDVSSASPLCMALPTKSSTFEYGPQCIADLVKRGGHLKAMLICDPEPATIAYIAKVREVLAPVGIEVDERHTPRRSSASIGALGRMQQTCQKQIRALRTDVHQRYSVWLSPTLMHGYGL